jgi:hypothetical protein
MRPGVWRISIVFVVLLLSQASAANAQPTGRLHGKVVDDSASPLSGVRVTLEGPGIPQVQVTDNQGEFDFDGIPRGRHALAAELEGFAPFKLKVTVSADKVTTIVVTLQVGAMSIPYVSEPPFVDVQKIAEQTTTTERELENIPTARDPWAFLQQAPGVLADRFNIGGTESGHASMYVEPGASPDASIFLVDGVEITDLTNPGTSPTYYDSTFVDGADVTTGGGNALVAGGGVVSNIVPKGGTNRFTGSGLYRFDPAAKSSATLASGANALDSRDTNLRDYSASLGGPLLKNKLWFFGGSNGERGTWNFGAADGRFDSPGSFTSHSINVTSGIDVSDRINIFLLHSRRSLLGPSSDLDRARSSLWNSDASLTTIKVEDGHLFNPRFLLTGAFSTVRAGVNLAPVSGDSPAVYGVNNVWRNGFIQYESDRPQTTLRVDGANLINYQSLSHELKYGASYRTAHVAESTRWPQGFADLEVTDGSFSRLFIGNSDTNRSNRFSTVYVQHELLLFNLTTIAGIRFEHDTGTDGPNTRSGNPLASLVQPVTQAAQLRARVDTFAPRLGIAWSPSVDRVILRGGYGVYFDQLPLSITAYSTDVRGSTAPDGAIVVDSQNVALGSFDSIKNQIDPDFRATRMSEAFGGVEVRLAENFTVGLRYTQRTVQDLPVLRDLVLDGTTLRVATTNDTFLFGHLAGTDPYGQTVSIPVFSWKLGVTPYADGQLLTNSAASTEYKGASVTFNKRLAHHWMLRGTANFNDWSWNVPAAETLDRPFGLTVGAGEDGETVAPHSSASDAVGVYINSKFSYELSGLYEIGGARGIDASFNVYGRQGYPMPFYAAGGGYELQSGHMDDHRYPGIAVVDVGARKTIRMAKVTASVGMDCFNAAGAKTITQVALNLLQPGAGDTLQTLSPRAMRVGVRITF